MQRSKFLKVALALASFMFLLETAANGQNKVSDTSLNWPSLIHGSTHELAMNGDFIYVTGQNMNHVAKVGYDGSIEFWPMPDGSGPHGILFDKFNRLWVSL